MSGAQTSTFADPNVLLNTLSGMTTSNVVHNQLLNTEAQQQIASTDMEQVGRAASWIDTLPADQKPQAYQAARMQLQAAGFAKNAPAEYPGDQAITMLARQSIPVPDQYKLGIVTPPGTAAAINAALTPSGTQPAQGAQPTGQGGQPPAAPSGGGSSDFNFGNIRPVGATAGFNTYATPQDGIAAMSANLRAYQTDHGINTLNGLTARWAPKGDGANDPVAYAKRLGAMLGIDPDAQINLADPLLQTRLIPAMASIEKGRPFSQPPDVLTAGIQAGLSGKGGVPVAATPGGVAARTGGVNVAGPGAPTAAPAAPQFTYPNGKVGGAPDPTGLVRYNDGTAGTPPAGTPVPVAAATPAAPVVAQGGQPPAPAPAAPAQPTGPQANLPHASEVPTGPSSPQYQQAMDLQRRAMILDAQPDPTGRLKTLAAGLRSQAALILQSDSVVNTQEGQLHTMTGKLDDAAKPAEHWTQNQNGTLTNASTGEVKSAPVPAEVWQKQPDGTYINQATGKPMSAVTPQEIWVKNDDGTYNNLSTGKPMFPPSARLTSTPGGVVLQAQPGGGAKVVYQTSPEDVAAQAQAHAAGTAAGTAAGKLVGTLADQGRSAGQAIGNIDYGVSQIQKAKAGGINTGYFAPWLSTASAALKSLGLSDALGVDPSAVGNIQTAQKTLAVVSGAILNQILGPESQVTDAKIQHFIHAQPGIETDPDALGRVLNWARSQFVYEREMSAQGMKDAKGSGTLPPGWQAKYYDEHGFAPIYNPASGEMQQPDGGAPSREPPATVPTAPVNPAARTAGTTYSTPKGPMKWDGKLWQPPGQ